MIEFDTTELERFAKRLKGMRQNLRIGMIRWFNMLQTDNDVNIQLKLKDKIHERVYQDNDNEMYERTGDLLEATRIATKGNQIFLYMDEQWLGSRPQANEMSESYGFDIDAHSGEGYAFKVEYDHFYENTLGGNPYYREGSKYMEATYREIKREIQNGTLKAHEILRPLFKEWGR